MKGPSLYSFIFDQHIHRSLSYISLNSLTNSAPPVTYLFLSYPYTPNQCPFILLRIHVPGSIVYAFLSYSLVVPGCPYSAMLASCHPFLIAYM